jgi:hypothetical protein
MRRVAVLEEITETSGLDRGLSERLNDYHDLRKSYGYSVGGGIAQDERRSKLERAIKPPPFGLGLQAVAFHINGLININARKEDPPINAIAKWKADLDWLHREYYEGSVYSFVWPNPDLSNALRSLIESSK